MPKRIQRKRTKGWKMPPNTVSVARPGPWGNPFVVGKHGTQAECVRQYEIMLAGYINLCKGNAEEIIEARQYVVDHIEELRGKNLACWCKEGTPCHAEVLLKVANT